MSASPQNLFDRPLPPGYRDELQVLTAARPEEAARQTASILLFQLGGLRLALPTQVASAVGPVLHIARIPHRSGTVLLGLAAFRGDILPCCSLARILDLQPSEEEAAPQPTTARTLILDESRGRSWAVPIDAMLGVSVIALHPDQPPAEASDATPLAPHWVRATLADAAGTFYLLDEEVLFRQITLATA